MKKILFFCTVTRVTILGLAQGVHAQAPAGLGGIPVSIESFRYDSLGGSQLGYDVYDTASKTYLRYLYRIDAPTAKFIKKSFYKGAIDSVFCHAEKGMKVDCFYRGKKIH